jgi:hypothetical protein
MNPVNMQSLAAFVLLLTAFTTTNAATSETHGDPAWPMTIAELKQQLAAPQTYSVAAYVIKKFDKCPPCPTRAICETCELGIYIGDRNGSSASGASQTDGLFLRTGDAAAFQVGTRYLFTLSYRLETNQAGARLQTGPVLVDYSPIHPDEKRQ